MQCQRQEAEKRRHRENRIARPATKFLHGRWRWRIQLGCESGALGNVGCLGSLLAFADFELYCVAFLQALVALGSDCAVMYKNVGTIRAADEPVAFCVIEPLYRAFQTFHVPPLSARPSVGGPKTCPHRMHFGAIGFGVSRRNGGWSGAGVVSSLRPARPFGFAQGRLARRPSHTNRARFLFSSDLVV
jgi:hypothetical protein